MEKYFSILHKLPMLKDKTPKDMTKYFKDINIVVSSYPKGAVVISDTEPADSLGIVISGSVEAQKIFPSGKTLTIARFGEFELIAEAAVFSSPNVYHATIVCREDSKILFISREDLLLLFSRDNNIVVHFLELFSNRIILLNQKIELLSLESTRQKIAHFLIKEMKKQNSHELVVLPFSKLVLAEHMNITRPSLSRELAKMSTDGWISVSGRRISIKDLNALENVLL